MVNTTTQYLLIPGIFYMYLW